MKPDAIVLAERQNPGLVSSLDARYGARLPGLGEAVVTRAFGDHYGRAGLDLRTRLIATVAALAALGGQTGPRLRINLRSALAARTSRRELAEAIWQMSLCGGPPAAINALNTALDVFARIDAEGDNNAKT